jgi:hypothetical protein
MSFASKPATCGDCGLLVAHSVSGAQLGRADRLCYPCYKRLYQRRYRAQMKATRQELVTPGGPRADNATILTGKS